MRIGSAVRFDPVDLTSLTHRLKDGAPFEAGDVPGYRFGTKGGPVRFLWADWELFLRNCRVGPSLEVAQARHA